VPYRASAPLRDSQGAEWKLVLLLLISRGDGGGHVNVMTKTNTKVLPRQSAGIEQLNLGNHRGPDFVVCLSMTPGDAHNTRHVIPDITKHPIVYLPESRWAGLLLLLRLQPSLPCAGDGPGLKQPLPVKQKLSPRYIHTTWHLLGPPGISQLSSEKSNPSYEPGGRLTLPASPPYYPAR
jgi:hypothetical protein